MKTAQCQWQRYVSLFVFVLLNTTTTKKLVGGTFSSRVCLTKLMRYEILENFFLSPQIQQQKDFSSLLNTTRALPFLSSKHCVVLFSVRDVFLIFHSFNV